MDISTPSNPHYGQWLSKEEEHAAQVGTFVIPKPETVTAVKEWLSANGLKATVFSPFGDWICFDTTVSRASELFDAESSTFVHDRCGKSSIRALAYSIPASLKDHLKLDHLTITCLQRPYGTPNKLTIVGFLEQFANKGDLGGFLRIFRPDLPPRTTFTLQTIDGSKNLQYRFQAGIEADHDVQCTIGLASGVLTVFVSVGDQYQDGECTPQVLTTSYGRDENTISRARLCNAYASLSARGITILFSSGDGGVSGAQNQRCTTFNYFDTPSYQTTAKTAYLTKLGSTYAGRFNTSGRGFPDIVSSGYVMSVEGTSCSSPIFASVVSLLNDRLIAAGKPVLGFLNPFLYSTGASVLNDITTGSNPGCNTNSLPATVGWDPVTGLGTPNWAKLLAAVGL
ncbi:family S53 protease [Lactarius sanguifluus]|nr:family S53 protease [Lactarius sanguifluus]